ncbi:chromate transporter [Prolixibacteraceae bacterium Z1-6]|uniref:Chromate transporter n=1 Tax=Draconibacterium aestuarii TaxID=2998507 RepID=A0A9X3F927_9BACT|nr:chromate transporter [Prolixibacteraceae bacterium Z1-6]
MNDLWKLSVSFFKIGLFNFGGGLAMIPLIIEELEKHAWMEKEVFFNFFSLSQMTPGAIAMNTASYVGVSVAGVPGAIVTTTSLAAPSIVIMLLLSRFLRSIKRSDVKEAVFDGLKPVTVALILYAGLNVSRETHFYETLTDVNYPAIVLSLVCKSVLVWAKKFHPILLLFLSGVAGLFLF